MGFPWGLDFGNQNCALAVARKGGIDVIDNEASSRRTPWVSTMRWCHLYSVLMIFYEITGILWLDMNVIQFCSPRLDQVYGWSGREGACSWWSCEVKDCKQHCKHCRWDQTSYWTQVRFSSVALEWKFSEPRWRSIDVFLPSDLRKPICNKISRISPSRLSRLPAEGSLLSLCMKRWKNDDLIGLWLPLTICADFIRQDGGDCETRQFTPEQLLAMLFINLRWNVTLKHVEKRSC